MGNTKRTWKSKRKGKGKGKGKSKRYSKHKVRSSSSSNKKQPIAYGHVYSTDCVHCIRMQNDWDKLTDEVKTTHSAIELIDISQNHQENVDAMNKTYQTDLKFLGFPTIFQIVNKNAPVQYYQGDRSTEDMKKWLFP